MLAVRSVYINQPPPSQMTDARFSLALTGTGGHTAGTEGVSALRVGHGFERVRVVGDQGWAVQLTDATVVEVKAGLGGGAGQGQAAGGHWAPGSFLVCKEQQGRSRWGDPSPCTHPRAPWAHTRQSECLGPVQPAAHCSWQQSVGFGPLQRAQPPAQTVRVTVRQGAA